MLPVEELHLDPLGFHQALNTFFRAIVEIIQSKVKDVRLFVDIA